MTWVLGRQGASMNVGVGRAWDRWSSSASMAGDKLPVHARWYTQLCLGANFPWPEEGIATEYAAKLVTDAIMGVGTILDGAED